MTLNISRMLLNSHGNELCSWSSEVKIWPEHELYHNANKYMVPQYHFTRRSMRIASVQVKPKLLQQKMCNNNRVSSITRCQPSPPSCMLFTSCHHSPLLSSILHSRYISEYKSVIRWKAYSVNKFHVFSYSRFLWMCDESCQNTKKTLPNFRTMSHIREQLKLIL